MNNLTTHLDFISDSNNREYHKSIWYNFVSDHLKDENISTTSINKVELYVRKKYNANLNLVLQTYNLTDQQKQKLENRISIVENNTRHIEEVQARTQTNRQYRLQNRTQEIMTRAEKARERIRGSLNSSMNGSGSVINASA